MTTSTTNPAAPHGARFTFKCKGLDVEFEGGEDFLCAQIEHLKPAFARELKIATPAMDVILPLLRALDRTLRAA